MPTTPSPGQTGTLEAGFAPGPVTRFLEWVATLPFRGWWVFPGIAVLQFVWAHGVLWGTGRLAVGSFDPNATLLLVYGPYALAGLAFGHAIARRALANFWPATGWPESERAVWALRFARPPGRLETVALVAGIVAGFGALAALPASMVGPEDGRLAVYLAYAPEFVLGYGLLGPALVVTVHWLRLVARIHREATAIDLFDRAPIYAFSRVTVLIGISYVAGGYYSLTVNASAQAGNLPSLASLGVSMTIGVLAFVAPLWGIHGRLVDEKAALTRDLERRTNVVAAEVYARIDAGTVETTAALNDSLATLGTLRARIDHLPTWPWPPRLFGGFVSALLLPIVIFVLTRVVSTFLEG